MSRGAVFGEDGILFHIVRAMGREVGARGRRKLQNMPTNVISFIFIKKFHGNQNCHKNVSKNPTLCSPNIFHFLAN